MGSRYICRVIVIPRPDARCAPGQMGFTVVTGITIKKKKNPREREGEREKERERRTTKKKKKKKRMEEKKNTESGIEIIKD